MQDRTISVNCLAAWLLWTSGVALWAASIIWDARGPATLGIIVAVGAATVTVRGLMRDQAKRINNALDVASRLERVRPL